VIVWAYVVVLTLKVGMGRVKPIGCVVTMWTALEFATEGQNMMHGSSKLYNKIVDECYCS
jgi:hypothetical protein